MILHVKHINQSKQFTVIPAKSENIITKARRQRFLLSPLNDLQAKVTAVYMDEKVQHYEQILSGSIPDDSNPKTWTEETRQGKH